MKERELIVVTVVRGGKVDIGDEIAGGAAWRLVRALENPFGGNEERGTPVHRGRNGHCLSNFCTAGVESFAARSVRNVSKRSVSAWAAEIELCRLSTGINVTKENGYNGHLC